MSIDQVTSAVLRVGTVTGVSGQRVTVRVDSQKNMSDLFFHGDLLRNVSVTGFVEVRKGFLRLIGQVEGENLQEDFSRDKNSSPLNPVDRNYRELQVSLTGYIDGTGRFRGGLKEFPLIGNEVFLMTKELVQRVHNLASEDNLCINVARSDSEGFPLALPIDGLFNSHIAIFGNTGSGKSNTLASLYSALQTQLRARNAESYAANTRYCLIDFNGEYEQPECIGEKFVYRLSTGSAIDRIPIPASALLSHEIICVLADATEKTQKPFLKRAIRSFWHCFAEEVDDSQVFFQNQLKKQLLRILKVTEKQSAFLLLDYVYDILEDCISDDERLGAREEIGWHGEKQEFIDNKKGIPEKFIAQDEERAKATALYSLIDQLTFDEDIFRVFEKFMYLQLIRDVLENRAVNEHIAPVILRLRSKRNDLSKVLGPTSNSTLWKSNFVVVSLDKVNLALKKTLPLILAKWLYDEHKANHEGKSLTLIIDEAHNILSTASSRESENWKDYRLETFEEIIKEGRKFGVFMTIASQRPSDISTTITSQAHNYFIHRLVNQNDLYAVASAVSFIDKVSEQMIPKLPVGTCIFSGVATQMPLRLAFDQLPKVRQPKSQTRKLSDLVSDPLADL
tara:strand:- start:339 stop:2201 length:1863 start_codon:yes stop_codon:yes gene_type:complete